MGDNPGARGQYMRTAAAMAVLASVVVLPAVRAEPIRAFAGHEGTVFAMAIRPDGLQVVTGGFDRSIRIWNPSDAAAQITLTGHVAAVTALAFSPDGLTLASGDSDGGLMLWRPGSSPQPRRLEGHPNCTYSIA